MTEAEEKIRRRCAEIVECYANVWKEEAVESASEGDFEERDECLAKSEALRDVAAVLLTMELDFPDTFTADKIDIV